MDIRNRIIDLLGKIESPVILEIGAHLCEDSKWMLHHLKNPRIYAIEPMFENLMNIVHHSKTEGNFTTDGFVTIDDRIKLYPFAIGNSNREQEIFKANNGVSSSLTKPLNHLKFFPEVTFNQTQKVIVLTLDTFLERFLPNEKVDFIWMDTEGAENQVFEGAINSFKKIKYIYTEYSNNQLREGQLNLENLLKLVPDYTVIEDYRHPEIREVYGDVLLENKNLKS